MRDILLPNNNELELIEMAKRLGYSELLFLYPFDRFVQKKYDFPVKSGIICTPEQVPKVKARTNIIFVKTNDARPLVEKGGVTALIGLEENFGKDFLAVRNSGLNQVLAKLAAQHNVGIAFSLKSIINCPDSRLLARISQNIMLCKKYKVKMYIGSFASSPYEMKNHPDVESLFETLGLK